MVKVIWVVGSFCDVCSMAIWPIHFIWGTNKTHGGMMHHTPLPGQKVKVIFRSVPIWPICLIWGINTTHEVTISHTLLPGQKVKSRRSFDVLAVSASWLHAYLTDLCHMWHKFNPWEDNVSCTINISRSKGQGHTDHSYLHCWSLGYVIPSHTL